ncbi:MAG: hypothetical protein GY756_23665, partial [bacterium]|nr:hypothetical protein [bacterium]
ASENNIEKFKKELSEINIEDLSDENLPDQEIKIKFDNYFSTTAALLLESYMVRFYNTFTDVAALMYSKTSWNNISPHFIYSPPKEINANTDSKFLIHPEWNFDSNMGLGRLKKYDGQVFNIQEPYDDASNSTDPYNSFYREFLNIGGYTASYNEGNIFDDWQDTNGISTVKCFMI